MKVLLINGSPHAHGCTYTALSVVADEMNKAGVETEIVHVGHKEAVTCGGSNSVSPSVKNMGTGFSPVPPQLHIRR